MQQSLSELLADTHKQESGHQFAYPEMSVWVVSGGPAKIHFCYIFYEHIRADK